ncbi:FHA domain-containing protein [Bifidobacterium catulorum]|uniref:FHA domain-containing protein n=1 Tax=Bifidobacterium catulorum TaxID=1630173 RepID=A0A2U2MQZ4_9BIFI|nr:FHA domain-containing protein [Bifidobacterium catulorum]PWG59272.1 hypothetical protein DF200_08535 [Bifidobacterium catulorum]
MRMRIKRNWRVGARTLRITATGDEALDTANAQWLTMGGSCWLPFRYEVSSSVIILYYDVTDCVTLHKRMRVGFPKGLFTRVLIAIAKAMQQSENRRLPSKSVLWNERHVYIDEQGDVRFVLVPLYGNERPVSDDFAVLMKRLISNRRMKLTSPDEIQLQQALSMFVAQNSSFNAGEFRHFLAVMNVMTDVRVVQASSSETDDLGAAASAWTDAMTPVTMSEKQEGQASEAQLYDPNPYGETVNAARSMRDLERRRPIPLVQSGIADTGATASTMRPPASGVSATLPPEPCTPVTPHSVPLPPVPRRISANTSSSASSASSTPIAPPLPPFPCRNRGELPVPPAPHAIVSQTTGVEIIRRRDGRRMAVFGEAARHGIAIGRSHTANLRVTGNDDISRIHAIIAILPDGRFSLTDNNFGNGTFISGRRLMPRRAVHSPVWSQFRARQ